MKTFPPTVAAVLAASFFFTPPAVEAQFGLAARVATHGIGGEAALGLGQRFVVRGGGGVSRLDAETSFDQVPVHLELPDTWYNVGLDIYLTQAFRIGGGVLFKPDDPVIRGAFDMPVEIGGVVLSPSELGNLTGRVESNDRGGYVVIGVGRHTDSGVGLFLDVGAGLLGSPDVTLSAQGGTYDRDQLDALLEQESRDFEDDMKTYLRIWPILSLGVRIGFGGGDAE